VNETITWPRTQLSYLEVRECTTNATSSVSTGQTFLYEANAPLENQRSTTWNCSALLVSAHCASATSDKSHYVGFDLTPTYGTLEITYNYSTLIGIAKLGGTHGYQEAMHKFSLSGIFHSAQVTASLHFVLKFRTVRERNTLYVQYTASTSSSSPQGYGLISDQRCRRI
jgi:hypothetical protein